MVQIPTLPLSRVLGCLTKYSVFLFSFLLNESNNCTSVTRVDLEINWVMCIKPSASMRRFTINADRCYCCCHLCVLISFEVVRQAHSCKVKTVMIYFTRFTLLSIHLVRKEKHVPKTQYSPESRQWAVVSPSLGPA